MRILPPIERRKPGMHLHLFHNIQVCKQSNSSCSRRLQYRLEPTLQTRSNQEVKSKPRPNRQHQRHLDRIHPNSPSPSPPSARSSDEVEIVKSPRPRPRASVYEYHADMLDQVTFTIPRSQLSMKNLLGLVALLAFFCGSEAFASHSSPFTGQRIAFRGGSRYAKEDSDEANVLKCVMQVPPPTGTSTARVGEEHPEEKESGLRSIARSANPFPAELVDVEYVAETKLPTDVGQFQLRAYRVPGAPLGQEPCVIYAKDKPPFDAPNAVPIRIHDQCLTSEVFRSQRCDCKEQLQMSLNYIQKHGGCIIYLQQEGRGIGLANKVAAYSLQDDGYDTVDANLHLGFPEDSREYGIVPSILKDMRIRSIQLMTNNPRKVERLTGLGVDVERTLPMVVPQVSQYNRRYLETKQSRMRHENMGSLLSMGAGAAGGTVVDSNPVLVGSGTGGINGLMTPQKSQPLLDQYINNGTEMTANAVQVSLMTEEGEEAEGVLASEDGYCFGKQSVVDAIAAVARGEMVVVVDDMNRENEGDFIMAASQCTDLDMARIVRYSSGVVCVAMEEERMKELELPPMVVNNQDPKGTAFTVTLDATKEHGITTGISASDRATTMRLLADPTSTAVDYHRPGHIFPLRSMRGGVLTRDGHTEAAVDFSRLAGQGPCGVLCEIVSEENPTEMMRLPEMKRFCKRHGFILTSIVDLQQYRRDTGL